MGFFWLNDLSQNIWKNVGKQRLPNMFLLAEFCFQFLLSKRFQICAYDHRSLVKAYLMLNTVSSCPGMKCRLLISVFYGNKTKM